MFNGGPVSKIFTTIDTFHHLISFDPKETDRHFNKLQIDLYKPYQDPVVKNADIAMGSNLQQVVNSGPGNGLVLLGNKPLTQPSIWHKTERKLTNKIVHFFKCSV